MTLFSNLEVLDFADDLALVSHAHQHMQDKKPTRLSMFAQQVGAKVCQTKTEVMTLNVPNRSLVKVKREDLPTTEEFTYLSSTVRHGGGARSRHQKSPQQGQERLQNAKQRMEVIPVQRQDQATFHPTVRLRILSG